MSLTFCILTHKWARKVAWSITRGLFLSLLSDNSSVKLFCISMYARGICDKTRGVKLVLFHVCHMYQILTLRYLFGFLKKEQTFKYRGRIEVWIWLTFFLFAAAKFDAISKYLFYLLSPKTSVPTRYLRPHVTWDKMGYSKKMTKYKQKVENNDKMYKIA